MFKRVLFFAIMLFLLGNGKMGAQAVLRVVPFDGAENRTKLSPESRITFCDDNISIFSVDDNTALIYPISDVRKLLFSGVVYDMSIFQRINIYPNPVDNDFAIDNIDKNCELIIYSMNGVEMLHVQYHSGKRVNVGLLKPGNYIIRAGNKVGVFTKK